MKKIFLLPAFIFPAIFVSNIISAQSFSVNTDGSTANPSALLDVKSTTKGLLIPRMSKAERDAIASPAMGLLIFQTAPDSAGFYYHDGSKWNWMAALNGNADTLSWKRNGNAATNAATHFIGTTDNRPLNFRVNNVRSGTIDNVAYNSAFGYSGFLNNSSGTHNTAIGFGSMISNTIGNYNTSVGAFSFYSNVTGIRNTAIGTSALYFNNANDNTAVGYEALNQSSSVSATHNTAIGSNALRQNSSGTSNTAIGDSAGFISTTASFNVAVGKNAGLNNTGSWTTIIGIDAGTMNQASGNLFVGSAAGMKNTSGYGNTFVGDNAGRDNTTSIGNTFFGAFAGRLNTTGPNNTFIGNLAGSVNTSGSHNAAIGFQSLVANTTGFSNTATGSLTLHANTTGIYNTANGFQALYSNTTGSGNTAIGLATLQLNTTGADNTATGRAALFTNSSGNNNTANGSNALAFNTIGSSNTATGGSALNKNTTGNNNSAMGLNALYANTTGDNNTAAGQAALYLNTTGIDNTAIGSNALLQNTSGISNTAVGKSAGYNNLTGSYNSFYGDNAGYSIKHANATALFGNYAMGVSCDTSNYNSAFGVYAAEFFGSGEKNSFFGYNAAPSFRNGDENTVLGYQASLGDTASFNVVVGSFAGSKGNENVFIGHNAGKYNFNASMDGSTYVGSYAGFFKRASYSVLLGYNSTVLVDGLTNATAIGSYSRVDISNAMVLGSTGTNVGIGTSAPHAPLQFGNTIANRKIVLWENTNTDIDFYGFGINGGTLRYQIPNAGNVHSFCAGNTALLNVWGTGNATLAGTLTQLSDARLKQDIIPINSSIDEIKKLNAYTYYWKDEKKDRDQQIGLLAQEVEKVFPQLVKKDVQGLLSVNYSGFVPLLIKGMQEQQQMIADMQKRMELLEEQNKLLLQSIKNKN